MALSGHGLVHCTCLLLTQSGHRASLNDPHSNRYDARPALRGGDETARVHQSVVAARQRSADRGDAQQQGERMRRIGVLSGPAADDQDNNARLAAFRQRVQQLGWTDGRNVRIDYRFVAGNLENYRKYAAELVALAPGVILAPLALLSDRVSDRCRSGRRRPRRELWLDPAAMPPASSVSNTICAQNGWNCSKRLCRA